MNDHSMRHNEDIARINYVLQHYDDAELSDDTSNAYKNRDKSHSKMIILSKK